MFVMMWQLAVFSVCRIEMSRCVQEVRMSRNNSLSGLTVQEIVAKVRDFILKEQTSKQVKKKVSIFPVVWAVCIYQIASYTIC